MQSELPGCARCPFKVSDRLCREEGGKSPSFCPTMNKPNIINKALEKLEDPDIFAFLKQASIQEGEGYADKELGYDHVKPAKPRILEVVEFARKMNYRRLGFAFCAGLTREAKVVENLFRSSGFEVVSSICKVGRTPKEALDIREEQKIHIGHFEPMCNPIAQALILNEAKTEFNVMLGLCVGHDSMFLKFADAPCTVLAVKDRLLGHNPLAAIYNIDSYYRALKKES